MATLFKTNFDGKRQIKSVEKQIFTYTYDIEKNIF